MSGNQEAFQKAMNQGHSAAWEQQWQQAVDYYKQALEEFPDHPGALTSLGLALFEQRRYEEALVYYLRAARVAPADPIPLEKAARIYELTSRPAEAVKANLQAAELQLKTQEIQKAVQSWQAVLQLQPENLTARTRLGMVYERTGKKPDAVSEYLTAAGILQRAGDLTKAVQLADYALKLVPESPDARRALTMLRSGQLLPRPGKPNTGTGPVIAGPLPSKTAVPSLAAPLVTGQDPVVESRKKAMEQLAAILFDQAEDSEPSPGQQRRGLSALARNLPGFSDDDVRTRILLHLSQAIESAAQSQEGQAAAELEKAEDAGLTHPAVHFMLGLLLNRSDRAKALRYLQKAVKHPDFALAAWLLTGQNYEDQENLPEAAQAYLQALRCADLESVAEAQRDELDQIYESLAESQSVGSDENSLKNICETITGQLLRADWRSYLREARAGLPQSGPGSPPVPLAEMLLETRSSDVVALLSRVRALAGQKKYRTALEESFYALQFAPTYLPLHVQIADMLMQEGHTQAAVSKYLIVAQLYTLRGEAQQAVRLLKRVLSLAPADITVRTALIDLLAAQGRMEEAVQQYTDLAEFYYQISDLDNARLTYLAALRLPQQGKSGRALSVQILHKVADIDMQRLDLRQAVKTFEQLRTLAPDDLQARTSLVEVNLRLGQDEAALTEIDGFTGYLDSTNQRAKAVEFLAALVAERPDRLDIRKRLADLYQRCGSIPEAVEQLDAIADELMAQKNRTAAIQVMERIIALNPPNVNDYRSALTRLKAV